MGNDGHGAGTGFELFARSLSAVLPGARESQPVDFSLRMIPDQVGISLRAGIFSIDRLNLKFLNELAEYLPLGPTLHQKLDRLSPRGELHYMRAKWVDDVAAPSSFSVEGKIHQPRDEKV